MLDAWAASSRIRQRSPWEKLLFSVGLMLESLLLPPLPGAAVILCLAGAATVAVAGVPFRVWLKALAAPAGFLLAGSLALAVRLGPGAWPSLPAEAAGPALLVGLRSLAAVSCLLFFAFSSPVDDTLLLLRACRVPAALTDLAMLTYRFLSALSGVAREVRISQAARLGYADLRTSLHSLAQLAAVLFVRAMDRSERLENGLAARGYDGTLRVLAASRPASVPVLVCLIVVEAGVWLGCRAVEVAA